MKIHELITILESHPNPEADVKYVVNVGNIDDPEDDVDCPNSLVLRQDDFYEQFVEILVSNKEVK